MANANDHIKDLIAIDKPDQWKDFLFDLQGFLIESGYVGSLNETGRAEFAVKIQALYHFFTGLQAQTNKQ